MKYKDGVTIQDVANLANVSTASVSNVINNKPNVSRQTRDIVEQAMSKLNYRPNNAARSLRARKSYTIGLVTEDIEGLFTNTLVRGIEEGIRKDGFHAFLCNSYGNQELEQSHIEALAAKQVDGFIFLNGYEVKNKALPISWDIRIPLVFLYQYTTHRGIHSVIPDDHQGGLIATQHLIELGHQRVGLINGPEAYEASGLRFQGYQQALQTANLSCDPLLIQSGEWNQTAAYHMTNNLLDLDNPPTAIFCTSDLFAIGVDAAVRERSLHIPQDISLIGFDNRYFAANQNPPLTTVELPLQQMGNLAGQLLLSEISNPGTESQIHQVPCKLIVRNSTAPPASKLRKPGISP